MTTTVQFTKVKAVDLKPGMRIGHSRMKVTGIKMVRHGVYVSADGGQGSVAKLHKADEELQIESDTIPVTDTKNWPVWQAPCAKEEKFYCGVTGRTETTCGTTEEQQRTCPTC